MPRMGNLSLFIIFYIFIRLASCRFLDGLYLNPEILKTFTDVRVGNDYMDYNPEYILREVTIIDIPVLGSDGLEEIIEIMQEDIFVARDEARNLQWHDYKII